MNIFVLDTNPISAAQQQCDKHIVKMPLETAQMLCTAVHLRTTALDIPYKAAYRNHPCTVWARENSSNFEWLIDHGLELCAEYTRRYNREHKCQRVIMFCSDYINRMPSGQRTAHPLCMPDKYKVAGDPVTSYRNYYLGDKKRFAKWKTGQIPNWWS